ncbi:MAG TPA: DUF4230 domain-containing protein [Candidatus Fermentibacter daniensis]|nr:MAG: hypothetical protein AO396_05700 [Candidatus Fermentibacter daniensis]MBP7720887.1 DUF4230 domain-containing protein [Candidatus Fermentibacter sp.]NLI02705.1 DUF4230 domain-containing protein [Candidatus Fermentibacter daniensis]HOF66741.1 DUF4230 domain-containing protein [Candidatus Fermentibacter daniensis]HOR07827.1 DUF4230 domain-containing protein [Candidatus Fermentibacter daniensis]
MNGRTASIAVIAASAAVLAFVVLDRTGALRPERTEAGPEYIEAVRGLYLLELAEMEFGFMESKTVKRDWWNRIPFDELVCELEVGVYYTVRVTAGIDMAGVPDDILRIEGRRVCVSLPAPEIVNTVVRESGSTWIRTGGPPRNWDAEVAAIRASLEADAAAEAEEDAIEAGMIQTAESVAAAHVTRALESMGMEEIHVSFE